MSIRILPASGTGYTFAAATKLSALCCRKKTDLSRLIFRLVRSNGTTPGYGFSKRRNRTRHADGQHKFRLKPKKRDDFDVCADQFRALADPLRLQLVCLLFTGPLDVTHIYEAVGVEIVMALHHLGVLNYVEIAQRRREGRNIIHSLNLPSP